MTQSRLEPLTLRGAAVLKGNASLLTRVSINIYDFTDRTID